MEVIVRARQLGYTIAEVRASCVVSTLAANLCSTTNCLPSCGRRAGAHHIRGSYLRRVQARSDGDSFVSQGCPSALCHEM
eukprot:48243-Eustigmatos_ZCMA.PRE.1